MRIDTSVGKKITTLKWQYLGENISIRFPSRVEAEYSDSKELIVAAGADGIVHLIKLDGSLVSEFSFENTGNCKLYILTKSPLSDLGITMVMAHDPEYKNERFWQHEINVNTKQVSGPIRKWR